MWKQVLLNILFCYLVTLPMSIAQVFLMYIIDRLAGGATAIDMQFWLIVWLGGGTGFVLVRTFLFKDIAS